jgi:pimeloyl-ACP methyl ester carboxylesterase
MTYSVQCHEELAFSSIEEFLATLSSHPEIAPMYENGLLGGLSYRVCPEWGAGRAEASANEPVASDIPTLVMGGGFDPVTPPDWGRHAAETLSNAFYYEYPGLGHGAAGAAECPEQMMIAFLQNPHSAPRIHPSLVCV